MRQSRNYLFGVAWIGDNDDVEETSLITISKQLTVVMLADIFNKDAEDVAQDVINYRAEKTKYGIR